MAWLELLVELKLAILLSAGVLKPEGRLPPAIITPTGVKEAEEEEDTVLLVPGAPAPPPALLPLVCIDEVGGPVGTLAFRFILAACAIDPKLFLRLLITEAGILLGGGLLALLAVAIGVVA